MKIIGITQRKLVQIFMRASIFTYRYTLGIRRLLVEPYYAAQRRVFLVP